MHLDPQLGTASECFEQGLTYLRMAQDLAIGNMRPSIRDSPSSAGRDRENATMYAALATAWFAAAGAKS